jgi:hypothetical protein
MLLNIVHEHMVNHFESKHTIYIYTLLRFIVNLSLLIYEGRDYEALYRKL